MIHVTSDNRRSGSVPSDVAPKSSFVGSGFRYSPAAIRNSLLGLIDHTGGE